jgi:hypothetical protein
MGIAAAQVAIFGRYPVIPSRAAAAWPAAQSLLARAGWVREQPVNVAGLLAATPELTSFRRQNRSHEKEVPSRATLREGSA